VAGCIILAQVRLVAAFPMVNWRYLPATQSKSWLAVLAVNPQAYLAHNMAVVVLAGQVQAQR